MPAEGPVFTQRGGARLDSFNATWPFAKLSVTSDTLILDVLFAHYEFPRRTVEALRPYRGFGGLGLIIEHTVVDLTIPWLVIFWTFNYRALEEALAQAGYPVLDRTQELKWWRDRPWYRPRLS
jgi:hypothetical protein